MKLMATERISLTSKTEDDAMIFRYPYMPSMLEKCAHVIYDGFVKSPDSVLCCIS